MDELRQKSEETLTFEQRKRLAMRLRTAKRIHIGICITYLYEIFLVTGFWLAGYIAGWVVPVFAALCVLINGIVFIAFRTGWNLRFADPSLFLFQEFCALGMVFFITLAAPHIAIHAFCMWVAVTSFGFLAPKRRDFLIALLVALGMIAASLLIAGPHLAAPTSSLAGQALTWAAMFGVLLRSLVVASFVDGLRRRLKDKNRALQAALARIELLAQRDELTGLPNRRSVMEWLEEQIALCNRNGQPLTIALIDLDHFKRVNDHFGHLIGDRVLQKFAAGGLAAIRATDCLGRFGGEEFLVGLVNTPLQAAEDVLQRIRVTIAGLDWSDIDARVRLTVTIGAAGYRANESMEQLIKRADIALYRGKEGGRDRVVLEERPFAVNLIGIGGQLSA